MTIERFQRLEAEVARRLAPVGPRTRWRAPALAVACVVGGVLLPFVVLLRLSSWFYGSGRLGTWSALLLGAVVAVTVVAALAMYAAQWVRQRAGWASGGRGYPGGSGRPGRPGGSLEARRFVQGSVLLVAAYIGYGLVFLSAANAKSEAVRAEYRSLHPVLRLAVSTLVLADGELLVTDAARRLEDYGAMGLPENESSLHLTQRDGYAHAVDLQTNGRSWLRNGVTRAYFALLGFRTLRHGGTGDHLHVSLPLPPRR